MIECFLFVFLTLGLNAASLIAGGGGGGGLLTEKGENFF